MRILKNFVILAIIQLCFSGFTTSTLYGQSDVLKTPLEQEVLTLLTNEISGQIVYNNLVKLAGAPWIRDKEEFEDTFYEAQNIYDIARSYGIETVKLERYLSTRTRDYPFEGEFWITAPEKRLIARLGADAALVAGGSVTADVSGELIYLPPLTDEEIENMINGGKQDKFKGKIVLLWSHAYGKLAEALDSAGIQAVISFRTRDRYFDPNQVVYSSGSYGRGENLKIGFTVSWRQWSELLEDVEAGKKYTVRCKTRLESFQDKFETVFAWIPGTEPDKKGVVFTAHLFEGYTKRGANDNMGGCAVQLEILRALTKLIKNGQIQQPRRNIYFIWPNEISGSYEFIKQNPGFPDKLSVNINMDMVTEGLRINNSHLTYSECPYYLPNYYDGLAKSLMNYVWRTNDIVFSSDSPRGRPGGQYFPKPMVEKNGSIDAFRFFIDKSTGGSDHICFNNSSVGVPGIGFCAWPDQWYHADTDLPSKADPTQMKRIAFIGAASVLAISNCTDEILVGLLDVTSDFGYNRIAEREQIKALGMVESATAEDLEKQTYKAMNLMNFAIDREIGAISSIMDIYTGTPEAVLLVDNRIKQWELFGELLNNQLLGYAQLKAKQLNVKEPQEKKITSAERMYMEIVPDIHPNIKGKYFSLTRDSNYSQYISDNPDLPGSDLAYKRSVSRAILNYINGKRSVFTITGYVAAETGEDLTYEQVAGYIDILKAVDWIK